MIKLTSHHNIILVPSYCSPIFFLYKYKDTPITIHNFFKKNVDRKNILKTNKYLILTKLTLVTPFSFHFSFCLSDLLIKFTYLPRKKELKISLNRDRKSTR